MLIRRILFWAWVRLERCLRRDTCAGPPERLAGSRRPWESARSSGWRADLSAAGGSSSAPLGLLGESTAADRVKPRGPARVCLSDGLAAPSNRNRNSLLGIDDDGTWCFSRVAY